MKVKLTISILLASQWGFSQNIYFPPTTGGTWATLSPQSLGWCQSKVDSLYDFLDQNNTKGFILLKDGRIVLERYFGNFNQASPWYWASAGKTLTAFLVGIAQQEGYLNINDTTSSYLGPGWTSCSVAQEEKISIRHQLTMTSGLDDQVDDHYCTLDTCLVYLSDAGTRWAYHNGPYTLLDSVMQMATGLNLNTFSNTRLKNRIGMTGLFLRNGYNNVFYSDARSMARFGLLLLNRGNWDGTQVMTDTSYFRQMVNTSQSLNLSYGYLLWLNGKMSYRLPGSQIQFSGPINPNAPSDTYMAMGKNGQFINVVPSQNVVWIRMGDAPTNEVPFTLNDEIWEYINALPCSTTDVVSNDMGLNSGSVFCSTPNTVNIKAYASISEAELIDQAGRLLAFSRPNANVGEYGWDVGFISKGVYIVRVKLSNGEVFSRKVLVY